MLGDNFLKFNYDNKKGKITEKSFKLLYNFCENFYFKFFFKNGNCS